MSEPAPDIMGLKICIDLVVLDQRLIEEGGLPRQARPGDAGVDLRACIPQPAHLTPGEQLTVRTGIALHMPSANMAGLILPRSGLGARGLILGNSVGLIDSGYQGEISVVLWNRLYPGTQVVEPLERIAQLIFVPILQPHFQVVDTFSQETERGAGGFGHTGAA